jgi:hypothetical protein
MDKLMYLLLVPLVISVQQCTSNETKENHEQEENSESQKQEEEYVYLSSICPQIFFQISNDKVLISPVRI